MAAGRKSDAERVLDGLIETSNTQYVPAPYIAQVYAVLGREDYAFEWLEKAVEERGSTLISCLNNVMFDSLKTDPRFSDILNKVGLG